MSKPQTIPTETEIAAAEKKWRDAQAAWRELLRQRDAGLHAARRQREHIATPFDDEVERTREARAAADRVLADARAERDAASRTFRGLKGEAVVLTDSSVAAECEAKVEGAQEAATAALRAFNSAASRRQHWLVAERCRRSAERQAQRRQLATAR